MKYFCLMLFLLFFSLPAYSFEDAGVLMTPDCYSKNTFIDERGEELAQTIYNNEQQMYVEQKYGSFNSRGYLNSPKKSRMGGSDFDRNY